MTEKLGITLKLNSYTVTRNNPDLTLLTAHKKISERCNIPVEHAERVAKGLLQGDWEIV